MLCVCARYGQTVSPENSVEMLIDSQAEFEIKLLRGPFPLDNTILYKVFKIKLILKYVEQKINKNENISLLAFYLDFYFYFLFCAL